MDSPFGFEVWRQHREDLLREAERARLVKMARKEGRRSLFESLSGILREVLAGSFQPETHGVVPGPGQVADLRRAPGHNRRCRSKAA